MNAKTLLIGTLVGGLVYFFLGFLFYVVLLSGFFESHQGTATGVPKTVMEWWPILLGNFSSAALLTYIYSHWANISTFLTGVKAGALIGLLTALGWDMVMYDTTNLMTLTGAFADVLVYTVMTAIAGGVIGLLIPSK